MASFDSEEVINVHAGTYDGPQPYNFEPARRQREPEQPRVRINDAYLNFRQEYGPLKATRHEQYRYTAYRHVVRWAYRVLGRHIRKPIPSCVVSAIKRQLPEEEGTYKGLK
ncbi:hypothetical protein ABVT39_024007 [Epinephelus coioides]